MSKFLYDIIISCGGEEEGNVLKSVYLFFFIIVAGVIGLIYFELRNDDGVNPPLTEAKYVIGGITDTIDKPEAEKIPPNGRWHIIKELKETIAIDVLCHPSSSQIVDQNIVREFVDSFINSKYVEVMEYPKGEPDVKLYFRKKNGFIMAGKLYISEGVVNSPEGPVIKVDSRAVNKLMGSTVCKSLDGY